MNPLRRLVARLAGVGHGDVATLRTPYEHTRLGFLEHRLHELGVGARLDPDAAVAEERALALDLDAAIIEWEKQHGVVSTTRELYDHIKGRR